MEPNTNLVTQFLTVLLGVAIGLIGRDIITSKNMELLMDTLESNFRITIPFILSGIIMFVLIEYWRVTNSIQEGKLPPYILYVDLLFFLFGLIALDGFKSSLDIISDPKKQGFIGKLIFATVFLGIMLIVGLARYLISYSFYGITYQKIKMQVRAHSAGIILAIVICTTLLIKWDVIAFICSWTGFVVIVLYLITQKTNVSQT